MQVMSVIIMSDNVLLLLLQQPKSYHTTPPPAAEVLTTTPPPPIPPAAEVLHMTNLQTRTDLQSGPGLGFLDTAYIMFTNYRFTSQPSLGVPCRVERGGGPMAKWRI